MYNEIIKILNSNINIGPVVAVLGIGAAVFLFLYYIANISIRGPLGGGVNNKNENRSQRRLRLRKEKKSRR
jgi:hypothetical protein